jgi:putative phosphoesterase
MRIGIIADTHDKLARTITAMDLLIGGGAEALIHCGDVTGAEIVRACGVLPSYFVFGNNDDGDTGLRRAIEEVNGVCLGWAGEIKLVGKRIAVAHGHLTKDVRRLAAGRPDYMLFGHSHCATDRREGHTRWINPGALHRAAKYTVALLELETDFLQFLAVPR